MKPILAILLAIACHTAAQAEVIVEFDGRTWQGIGAEADFKQRVRQEGLCLVADDQLKVGDVLKGWEFERFERRSTRFALRGIEGKGALIESGEAIPDENIITIAVTCGPEGVTVGHINRNSSAVREIHTMDVDLLGAAGFLDTVREGSRLAREIDEFPLTLLRVRSNCSYGLLVRVLQLVITGGCRHVTVVVDDDFPGLDAEVRQDINMNLPGVDPAVRGRITVNFKNDGSLTNSNREVLATDEAITRYIVNERDRLVKLGKQPALFFRGEKETVFKISRRVIRLGADVGVTQVIFGVYAKPED